MVRVGGAEARGFLQGLRHRQCRDAGARRGPLGGAAVAAGQDPVRLPDDAPSPTRILLDVTRDKIADLVKRLTMYRLRAKVEIVDESENLGVIALFGGAPARARGTAAIPTSERG